MVHDDNLPEWYKYLQKTDSFGALKISSPNVLFNSKMTYGIGTVFDQFAVNGAAITHKPDLSGAELSVAAQANSRCVLQSAEYSHYMPGNGHEIKMTYGNISLGGACTFLVGYFDDNNGIFLKYTALGVSLVLRSAVTGAPVDVEISQENWNIDKLDGAGPSRSTFTLNARQIFAPNIEWLSVGTVLAGFYIDREFLPVHAFNHANSPGAAYITTADLPLRWELVGDGTNVSSVIAECCAVHTSNPPDTEGLPFSIDTHGLVSAGTTESFLLAIRPKALFNGKDNHVKINLKDIFGSTELATTQVRIRKNPAVTIDPGDWNEVDAGSAVEYALVATGFTPGDGKLLFGFPIPANQHAGGTPGTGNTGLTSKEPFCLHFGGLQDVIVITGETIEGVVDSDTSITLNWQEQQ